MLDCENSSVYFMELALKEARKSLKTGDVPIGAVIVRENKVIGKGHNQVEMRSNSIKHAEMIAIESALKNNSYKHLLDCEIYVTLEPCSMCAGAIILARIPKLIFAALDTKSGACGSTINIVHNEKFNHRCEVNSGILAEDSANLIKLFFQELREKKKIAN